MKFNDHIIIVDDDADDREILKDAFRSSNNEIVFTTFDQGDKLIDHLDSNEKQRLPSLILLDLNMPGKDGRVILKEIKSNELYHPVPVIIFTTSSSDRDRQIAYDLGANCFITKPDTFNQLMDLAHCISKLWLK